MIYLTDQAVIKLQTIAYQTPQAKITYYKVEAMANSAVS